MKKRLFSTSVLALLLISPSLLIAQQEKEQEQTEIKKEQPISTEKKFDGEAFDKVKFEVLKVTKELEIKGITNLPEYPKYIDLNSMTLYLEELKKLNNSTSSVQIH